MPLPDRDFDTTEVAVPWRLLTDAGHSVVFATERGGAAPATDPLLLKGVVFKLLGAAREPKRFYAQLLEDPAYNAPLAWDSLDPGAFDGLILPGGHAKGMRQYLGSEVLQAKVAEFWKTERPVGAICHGVLVLARAGVLTGRRTTCLPAYLEGLAYYSTVWRRGRYYRTYPKYVETEVRKSGAKFKMGPPTPMVRGTAKMNWPAFVVEDGNYVSARWPGDAYLFAKKFLERL
jgi:putative intracellular protease/amidase